MALRYSILWFAFGHLINGDIDFIDNNAKPNCYEGNMDVQVLAGNHKGAELTMKPMEYLIRHLNETIELESRMPFQAMLAVDRGHYTTWRPYANCITNIGYGAHMLAPFQQAMVLDDLADELTEGKKVLDIGSGNGYFTALLAWCVGKSGKVIGVEHIPQLVQRATHNVISGNPEFVKDGRIKFVLGDGRKGYVEEAPYDIIHVGGSIEDIPEGLLAQLKMGGSLFASFGPGWRAQEFQKVVKTNESHVEMEWIRQVWTAPIIEKLRQLRRYKNGKTIFYGHTSVPDPLYTPIHGK